MNKRIVQKIAKCLALATGTDNPTEAETAMRQAKALMEQYDVTEDDVAAVGVTEEIRQTGSTNTPPFWMANLGAMTAVAFGCKPLIKSGWGAAHISFIGVGCKPQLAAYTFEVLLRQLKRHRREYISTLKRCKRATKTRRANMFCQAWLNRVEQQITDFAGDERDKTAIEAYVSQNYQGLTTYKKEPASSNRCHDHEGAFAGHRAAAGITLNRPVQSSNNAYLE